MVAVLPVASLTRVTPDLDALVRLFLAEPTDLGLFTRVDAGSLPPVYRRLLDHRSHMTVTVEAHHQRTVDVEVQSSRLDGDYYARRILLRRRGDRRVVQFGIMRIDFRCVASGVRAEILRQDKPMGRIMIEHDVLREVHLDRLWQVAVGPELAADFSVAAGTITFGRTATIDFDGRPAMELLEIVAPEPTPDGPTEHLGTCVGDQPANRNGAT